MSLSFFNNGWSFNKVIESKSNLSHATKIFSACDFPYAHCDFRVSLHYIPPEAIIGEIEALYIGLRWFDLERGAQLRSNQTPQKLVAHDFLHIAQLWKQ